MPAPRARWGARDSLLHDEPGCGDGGAGGPASDIAIHAQEIIKARERIARTIARETGRPLDGVLEDIERDRWLSAEEAIEYGLVGRIINHKADLKR